MKDHLPIHVPVWDTYCHIFLYHKDLATALKKVKVAPDHITEIIEEQCCAITMETEDAAVVIVVKKKMDRAALIGTLAHESFHAAHMLLAQRDVVLRHKDNNEPHAYLLGFLVEQIYNKL
jgi:hypothetical protein